MARFGNTWWGSQWLNALADIDFSNRLPRGRAYAGNGSVKDIKIKGRKISAKVQGRRATPYQVEIEGPQFSQKQQDTLLAAIKESPLVLSKLLNGQLPGKLYTLAQENGIELFPKSWNDLSMDCSCPDWAVPCKHLAAVIYIIANEIDRNPFLVFRIHGLDILQKLEAEGFTTKSDSPKVPAASRLLRDEAPKNEVPETSGEIPDFSKVPPLRDKLLSLLAGKPLFEERDFKPRLKKVYNRIAKVISKLQKEKEAEEMSYADFANEYEQFRVATMFFSNPVTCSEVVLYGETQEKHYSKPMFFFWLAEYLDEIPMRYSDMLSPYLKALYLIYRFSMKLLEQSAIIPQILTLEDDAYSIRWIPAYINDEVKALYDELTRLTPEDLALVGDTEESEKQYFHTENRVEAITSMFLGHYVNLIFNTGQRTSDPTPSLIDKFFFNQQVTHFSGPGETEIPGAIHQWLSPFFIAHLTYVPLIKVVPRENNRFEIALLIKNRRDSMQEPVSLKQFMNDETYRSNRLGIMQSLARLAEWFSDIEILMEKQGEEQLTYSGDEFVPLLQQILPTVRMLGIGVLLPDELKHLVRPRSTLSLQQSQSTSSQSFTGLSDMLDFKWQVAIGDKMVSPEEFRKMVEGLSGVVRLKNQYVLIDRNEVQKVLKNLDDPPGVKKNDLLKAALTEEWKGAKVHISKHVRRHINDLLRTRETLLPEGLLAQLRPYQQRGYEWLYRNLKIGFGSIIADDMGLGKTLQVITTLLAMKQEGTLEKHKAVAVVPTTLLTNWSKEIEKFAPSLRHKIYHGPSRELKTTDTELLITTYGVVRSDAQKLQRIKWAMVIIDEAQNIKNPGTNQSKAVKKLKAPAKIAMSGTPVENRLSEYWSIFDFVNKGYLGSLKSFINNYARPIENDRNRELLNHFRQLTAPFIMRRLKTDKAIISELPEKVENDDYTSLTEEQAALYQSVVQEMMHELSEAEAKDDEGDSQINRLGVVLKMMTALKQVCNHPSHYTKGADATPERSGKTLMLFNLLESIYESNEKVLIFTQYKEMGTMLQNMIEEHFQTEVLFLHGSVPRKERDEMVEQFQSFPHLKTFILSIKAGGTGLNLTAANHVIHYDLWWNPAVENQATDRAFRIGQERNVMVYRLITQGTFEEKINNMLKNKKELADLTVTEGEKWLGDLSESELSSLVALSE